MIHAKRSGLLILAFLSVLACAVAPAAGQVDDYRKIQYPAQGEWKIPEPQRVEMGNGMVVFLLEDHELPLIDLRAVIRAGSRLEPPDKIGLTDILADVLRTGGAGRMTGDEMDEFLEGRGATLETDIRTASASLALSCLKEDFDDVLALAGDILMNPRFDPEKIELSKIQGHTAISRRNDNPSRLMRREFRKLIYGKDSPYARHAEYATIDSVTRDDLVAFHARYYKPNSVIVGVAGDFNTRQMVRKLKKVFGSWKKEAVEIPTEYAVKGTPDPGIYVVRKENVTQASIAVGHLGITLDNPDYFAVEVLNELFGRGFSSRLVRVIRSEKGLAYSVGGGIGAQWDWPGIFMMSMQTKSAGAVGAIEALYGEMHRLMAEPPTEEELALAKDGILNSFVFNFDDPMEVVRRYVSYEYFGFPLDFLGRFRSGVEKVTTEDVRRIAGTYIRPFATTVLVVGNDDEFDRPLSVLIEGNRPVVRGHRLVRLLDVRILEPGMEVPKETAESLARGAKVMGRMVEALGGRERVLGVKALKFTATHQIHAARGRSMNGTTWIAYPDRMRIEMETVAGLMTRVWDGKKGLIVTPAESRPMPEMMVSSFRQDLGRRPFNIARSFLEGSVEAMYLGEVEKDGRKADSLLLVVEGLPPFKLNVEKGTGRIVSLFYRSPGVTGGMADTDRLLRDYRVVDGIAIPFKMDFIQRGLVEFTTLLEEVEIDPEMEDSLFDTEG